MNMEEILGPAPQCHVLLRARRLDLRYSIESINVMKKVIRICLTVLMCALILKCTMVEISIDRCFDHGGAWDYEEWKCEEPTW